MPTFKILTYNVGHCSGLTGSVPHYVLFSHRHLRASRKVKSKVLAGIRHILFTEKPDLCCFLEIDPSSLDFLQHSLEAEYAHHFTESKYGETSVLRRMPHFSKRSNGILAKAELSTTRHYLKKGMKKLLYEIEVLDDLHVFAGHFALQKRTRRRQFDEVKELLARKERVILCGDFNIFQGFEELDNLIHHYDLKIINAEGDFTYPSHRPRKCIDLFICSRDVKVKNLKVMKEMKVSDHLPVILEVEV